MSAPPVGSFLAGAALTAVVLAVAILFLYAYGVIRGTTDDPPLVIVRDLLREVWLWATKRFRKHAPSD